jgi:hypothetical protein
MVFIFSNLPLDIIKYIITFDKHFILRNGEIISIIPKDDYRYNLLHYITLKEEDNWIFIQEHRYEYIMPNLYDIIERKDQSIENDITSVAISNNDNGSIKYSIYIGRLKPKNKYMKKKQIYYKGNLSDYDWHYILYEYTRI